MQSREGTWGHLDGGGNVNEAYENWGMGTGMGLKYAIMRVGRV